ncbi:MAG: O-antigen ligase family protein [Parvibaculum sp.]|nr:O-antigen ligase family protein [Parvibaculum sp.]
MTIKAQSLSLNFKDMLELFRQPESVAFAVLISLATWASVLAPRVMGAVMPIAAVCAFIGATRLRQRMRMPAMDNEVWWMWMFTVALIGASAFWSPDIGYGLERTAKIASSLAMAIFLFFLAGELSEAHRARLRYLLVASFIFALWLVAIFMITRVAQLLPLLGFSEYDAAAVGANRAAVVLAILMWPTVLAALEAGMNRVALALPFVTLGAISLTDSQTGLVVIIGGALVFGICRCWPRTGMWLTAIIGVALIVLMPFFFQAVCPGITDFNLYWGADAAVGERVEIWCAVTASMSPDWFLGHGVEAARFGTDWPMAHRYFLGEGILHPHNGALQIWYEYGVTGVLLASAIWLMVVARIANLGPQARAICFATLASIAVVSCISHGLWQSWWLGAVGVVPALFRMVAGRVWFSDARS